MRNKPFIQDFRSSDGVFEQLVNDRRQQVETLQRRDAERAKDLESRGTRRLKALQESLDGSLATTFKNLEKADAAESKQVVTAREKVRKDLSALGPAPSASADHPGFVYSHLANPHTSGWITPYYATLHGSNGAIWWQGYNPGTFDLGDFASGGGSGLFGTGAGSFTTYLDWWFYFRPESTHFFGHNIYVPFNGFYILYADDGFWDSKECAARIDLSAQGYQYNYKPQASNNLFNVDSQNINVNDRFDGWRTMYYGDLLAGGDTAYLRVSASFYVYARGGGSHAEWDFSSGSANYIGMPWVYFS